MRVSACADFADKGGVSKKAFDVKFECTNCITCAIMTLIFLVIVSDNRLNISLETFQICVAKICE